MKQSFLLLALVLGTLNLPLEAQQPGAAEHVLALKATMASGQAALRQFEWIETTVVSVGGEEKSHLMDRCYYGAAGKLQKVPLTSPPPEERRRGLRGRIAEWKKEELTDYMKEALALVHQYMPPDPARIQAAKEAGHLSIQPLEPGQRVRLTFSDYLKAGDSMALDLDLKNNHPLTAKVVSHLDSGKDPITLDVTFGTLDDGTVYTSESVLEAKSKNLKVEVENSGYRKTSP